MKRAESVAITQTAPKRNFHLVAMFLCAVFFSISTLVVRLSDRAPTRTIRI